MDLHPTFGQRSAEGMASVIGSWRFLIIQAIFLAAWVIWNTWSLLHFWQFDRPPYQGLNLLLSFQAAFTGPILLIAANFSAIRDRLLSTRLDHVTHHIERIAAADHVEHGEMLKEIRTAVREIHDHVYCEGHTVIAAAPPKEEEGT